MENKIADSLRSLTSTQLKSLLPCQSAATELYIKQRISELEAQGN